MPLIKAFIHACAEDSEEATKYQVGERRWRRWKEKVVWFGEGEEGWEVEEEGLGEGSKIETIL